MVWGTNKAQHWIEPSASAIKTRDFPFSHAAAWGSVAQGYVENVIQFSCCFLLSYFI